MVHAGGVGRAKDRADVVDGPHVVDHYPDGVPREALGVFRFGTLDFIPTQLAHLTAGMEVR
jgi:hypothetical protein